MNEATPFVIAVASGAVRCGAPVLYAALGELLTQRSGVVNLGLEGIMLAGACAAVVASLYTGSALAGVLAAALAGGLLGLVHAVVCVRFRANQVAAGLALTLLGSGLTAFLGIPYVGQRIHALAPQAVAGVEGLPWLGPILFSHDVLVYASYLLVPLTAVMLYRTRTGLALRASGEEPDAAAAAGIAVGRVRLAATVSGGALAGIGGAYLSLVHAQGWIENITAGRGWIAVGLVIFAAWDPWRAVLGAALFGGATSLQLRLQATGTQVSPYLLGMLPYLLVIGALVGAALRRPGSSGTVPQVGPPTALG